MSKYNEQQLYIHQIINLQQIMTHKFIQCIYLHITKTHSIYTTIYLFPKITKYLTLMTFFLLPVTSHLAMKEKEWGGEGRVQ